jgi:hypothetical protein
MGARDYAPVHFAFRHVNGVGTRDQTGFAAQWLAYMLPCRRFADVLADARARLGADVGRYSFIAVDFHHILLAGLPAHFAVGTRVAPRPPAQIRTGPIKASGSHLGYV